MGLALKDREEPATEGRKKGRKDMQTKGTKLNLEDCSIVQHT